MKKPNIVILVLDSLRADRLAAYGAPRSVMPFLDSLAARGATFMNNYTVNFMSNPTHVAMLTGTLPSYNKCVSTYSYYDGRASFLTDELRKHSYSTFGLCNKMAFLSRESGFIRGFDKFYTIGRSEQHQQHRRNVKGGEKIELQRMLSGTRARSLFGDLKDLLKNVDFLRTVNYRKHFEFCLTNDHGSYAKVKAIEAIAQERQGAANPFFLFANFADTHMPYSPLYRYIDQDLKSRINGRVLQAVFQQEEIRLRQITLSDEDRDTVIELADRRTRYTDDILKYVFHVLGRSGLMDNTVVFVTSDHGASFLERPWMLGHGNSLYNVELKTPLVAVGGDIAPRREEKLTSIVDLAPTILDLCGIPRNDHMIRNPGVNIFNEKERHEMVVAEKGGRPEHYLKKFRIYPDYFLDLNTIQRAFIDERHKLIWSSSGKHELYDLVADPHETTNLFPSNRAVARGLIDRAVALYRHVLGDAFFSLEVLDYNYADLLSEEILNNPQNPEDIIAVQDEVKTRATWERFFETIDRV